MAGGATMKRMLVIALILVLSACATRSQVKTIPDHPQTKFISVCLGRMLVSNSYDLSAVKFGILDTPEVNAMMNKEGILFITSGLLNNIPEDRWNEILAAVIAHELAHFTLSHVAKRQGSAVATSIGFAIAGAFIPGVGLLNHVVNPTFTSALSRSQELDADRKSVAMLRNAGWDNPEAICIRCLEWGSGFSDSSMFSLWASHPSFRDRIENIKAITQ